jgi:Isocitrate/isopropylmalate dehydrogenase
MTIAIIIVLIPLIIAEIIVLILIVMVTRAAHNYDGDMLTDEVAQVHRSPGFITSALLGKTDDNIAIKEFEASHGTVADLWHAHNRGEETSMNPLGMVSEYWSAPHTTHNLITSVQRTVLLYATLHSNSSSFTVIFKIQYTSLPSIEWCLLPIDLLFLFYFNFCFSMLDFFLFNSSFSSFQSLLLSSPLHSSPLSSSSLLLHHSSPLLSPLSSLLFLHSSPLLPSPLLSPLSSPLSFTPHLSPPLLTSLLHSSTSPLLLHHLSSPRSML